MHTGPIHPMTFDKLAGCAAVGYKSCIIDPFHTILCSILLAVLIACRRSVFGARWAILLSICMLRCMESGDTKCLPNKCIVNIISETFYWIAGMFLLDRCVYGSFIAAVSYIGFINSFIYLIITYDKRINLNVISP